MLWWDVTLFSQASLEQLALAMKMWSLNHEREM